MKETRNRSLADACLYHWLHWSGRGVLKITSVDGVCVDMPLVHCLYKRVYRCRLLDLLEAHRQESFTVSSTFPIHEVSLEFILLDYPLDS